MNPENKNYTFDEEQLAALEKLWKVSVSKGAPVMLEFRKALLHFIDQNWDSTFKEFGQEYDEKYFKRGCLLPYQYRQSPRFWHKRRGLQHGSKAQKSSQNCRGNLYGLWLSVGRRKKFFLFICRSSGL